MIFKVLQRYNVHQVQKQSTKKAVWLSDRQRSPWSHDSDLFLDMTTGTFADWTTTHFKPTDFTHPPENTTKDPEVGLSWHRAQPPSSCLEIGISLPCVLGRLHVTTPWSGVTTSTVGSHFFFPLWNAFEQIILFEPTSYTIRTLQPSFFFRWTP